MNNNEDNIDEIDLMKGVVLSPVGTGPREERESPCPVGMVGVGDTWREYEVWGTDEKGRGGYYWKGVTWRRLAALGKARFAWTIERQHRGEFDYERTWNWKMKTSCNGKGTARDEVTAEKVVQATKVSNELPPKL